MNKNTIGIIIKNLREENGFTSQQALADHLGISQSTIGNWEAGSRKPDYDMLTRLADLFSVSTDFLLGRESNHIHVASETGKLSPVELDLVAAYRMASSDDRAIIDNIVRRYTQSPATTEKHA